MYPTSTVQANVYSKIEDSAGTDSVSRMPYSSEAEAILLAECETYVDVTDGEYEFQGTDPELGEWRVHLVRE